VLAHFRTVKHVYARSTVLRRTATYRCPSVCRARGSLFRRVEEVVEEVEREAARGIRGLSDEVSEDKERRDTDWRSTAA
jgi:hypothetical protein